MKRWLAAVVVFASCGAVASAAEEEWMPLFNGQDLMGWEAVDGPLESWKVEDGILFCSGAGGGGWLSTEEEYEDFELSLEFRVPEGGNSGVFLRAPHEGNPAFAGMEIQVLDDYAAEYKEIQPHQFCGSLYGVVAAEPRVTKEAGQWQTMFIRCVGDSVQVTLNDTQVVDANLSEHPDKLQEHPGLARKTGYVGLQNHGSRLDYRNIKIRVVTR